VGGHNWGQPNRPDRLGGEVPAIALGAGVALDLTTLARHAVEECLRTMPVGMPQRELHVFALTEADLARGPADREAVA
jgi:hypothetical protein